MNSQAGRRAPAIAGFLLLAAVGCAGVERNPNVVGTYSDKLSPYNYKEEGLLARIVVGVEGARFIREEPYVPIFVQVSNKSKTGWVVTRESFTLEDSLGRRYPLAPAREVSENYPRLDMDRRLFRRNQQFTATAVTLLTYISSDFFPSPSRRSLLVDHVSLPPHTYMEDVLYFPIPETGLNGVPLRLLFKVKEIAEPIHVVFEVPRTLGIMEKDKPAEGGD
jgi:hypothetical protein